MLQSPAEPARRHAHDWHLVVCRTCRRFNAGCSECRSRLQGRDLESAEVFHECFVPAVGRAGGPCSICPRGREPAMVQRVPAKSLMEVASLSGLVRREEWPMRVDAQSPPLARW